MTIAKNCNITVVGKKLNEGSYNGKNYKNFRVSIVYKNPQYDGYACATVSVPFEMMVDVKSFPCEYMGTVKFYEGRYYVVEWSKL